MRSELKSWTKEEEQILRDNYSDLSNEALGKMMGRSEHSVSGKAYRLNLKKSKEHIALVKNCYFEKGSVPFNKGLKMEDYVSEKFIKKFRKTSFKKGHKPWNYALEGSERLDGDGYVKVKVGTKWKLKHRLLWVKHHGEVPRGYNIQFKDGNRKNVVIENLFMIKRDRAMLSNSLHRYPKEVVDLIYLKSKLTRTINRKNGEK